MNIVDFLILSLASLRTASLFVDESGPFSIFALIREKAGILHDENKKPYSYPNTFFGELLSCIWCFSMWSSAFWVVFYFFFPDVTLWVASWFAVSSAVILANGIINHE